MATTRRKAGEDASPPKKKSFTIWASGEDAARIEGAVAAAVARAGFPVSTAKWMLVQVMKGVEEEEKRGKGGGR